MTKAEILEEMKDLMETDKVPAQLVCEEENQLYEEKIPDKETLRAFRAKIKAFQLDEFVKKLHRDSIEMSDAEFLKLKHTQGEPFLLD